MNLASLRAELEELRAKAQQHTEFNNNLQGDGGIRVESGKIIFDRRGGVTGPTGATGATAAGIIGPQGRGELPGPTGATKTGNPGHGGLQGPTGITGPKMSVVRTHLGNVAFCPMEGSRPTIFKVYHGTAPCRIEISPRLLASSSPGSLDVFSVVASKAGASLNAVIDGDYLIVTGRTGARFTAVVAGIHRRFPDLDLPLVSDEAELRSRRFWAGEKA